MSFRTGLPTGWNLYRAQSADPSVPAPSDFPALKADSQIRIFLQGGIKTEAIGRRYFDFAPPSIRIEGLTPDAIFSFNSSVHSAEAGDVTFTPNLNEVKESNQIRVLLPNGNERSASFYTISARSLDWRKKGEFAAARNGAAILISDEQPKASGAEVISFETPPIPMSSDRPAELVGPRPGQLASLPSEELPTDWTPVWLVEHGRDNRRVIFCGDNFDSCVPISTPIGDRRKVKAWKHLLWNGRKRLNGPTRGPLVSLWRQYKELAENV
jgi:hypothetical protein